MPSNSRLGPNTTSSIEKELSADKTVDTGPEGSLTISMEEELSVDNVGNSGSEDNGSGRGFMSDRLEQDATRIAMGQTAYPAALASKPQRRKYRIEGAVSSTPNKQHTKVSTTKEGAQKSNRSSGAKDNTLYSKGGYTSPQESSEISKVLALPSCAHGTHRQAFISHCSKFKPGFIEWEQLDHLAIISGPRCSAVPYEDLHQIMRKVSVIGSSNMRTAIGKNVHDWMWSPYTTRNAIEVPDHLRELPSHDAEPFRRFWKATELCRKSHGFGKMAILLARKSWVDLLSAFHELVFVIRKSIKEGNMQLKQHERAMTKAKEILYTIVYPNTQTRIKARNRFLFEQRRATRYHKTQLHYGYDGILAMIPPKIHDGELKATEALREALLEVLDTARPDLRGPRVEFYAKIIDLLSNGATPCQEELEELDTLTACTVKPLALAEAS